MTKYKYYIIPQAAVEFRLAREWYQAQQVNGLSRRFSLSVKDCINRIRQNPFAFSFRYKDVRVAHTDTFPYSIHFYLNGDTIIVTSIIFQGRNPLISRNRM